MELIDILTPDGEPTGVVKDKRLVHRDGDWHRAAHLWIVASDRRVLLQRRSDTKENFPSLWDISVAGHISAGERSIDAIVREAFEELGLRIDPASLTFLGAAPYHAVLNDGAYIENEYHDIFLCELDVDLGSLVLDPAEVAEVALVALDDFDEYEMVPHPESHRLLGERVDKSPSRRVDE